MQSIVLYGLADEADSITSGTISFSDGTVVKIDGPISPKGSWVYLGEGHYSSSVRFTTAGTSPKLVNLGLSEIQICTSELFSRNALGTFDVTDLSSQTPVNAPIPSGIDVVGKLGNVSQGTTLLEVLKSLGLRRRRR
jgi:hypothetical protein